MLLVIWVLFGVLLVAHHVLVLGQALRQSSENTEHDNRSQLIARMAVFVTFLWISSTLIAELFRWI